MCDIFEGWPLPEQPSLSAFEAIDVSAGDHELVRMAFCRKYGWNPENTTLEIAPGITWRGWVATRVETHFDLPRTP